MSVPLEPGALVQKDPDAVVPWGFDWTDWLAEIGASETVAVSSWSIDGPDADLNEDSNTIITGSRKTQLVLSGGTLGKKYTVTNRITTSSGYEDDRSFSIRIVER